MWTTLIIEYFSIYYQLARFQLRTKLRTRQIIDILADYTHEEYESIVDWLGQKFDPIEFNRLAIEKELGILGAKIKRHEKGFE